VKENQERFFEFLAVQVSEGEENRNRAGEPRGQQRGGEQEGGEARESKRGVRIPRRGSK
jgi:hypothetical protein